MIHYGPGPNIHRSDIMVAELTHPKLGTIYICENEPEEVESLFISDLFRSLRHHIGKTSRSKVIGFDSCESIFKGEIEDEIILGVLKEKNGQPYYGGYQSSSCLVTYKPLGNNICKITGYLRLEGIGNGSMYFYSPHSRMPDLVELANEFKISSINILKRSRSLPQLYDRSTVASRGIAISDKRLGSEWARVRKYVRRGWRKTKKSLREKNQAMLWLLEPKLF